ncbi:MAG: AAA family ATPase [Candidatus Omnitrophota bacterium]
MFTEIGIENFKAFGKMQRIPLKPITLLYGPNSSGKSSLMHALLLLKQTLEESGGDTIVLLPKGNLVDLGSYQEFINGHDVRKEFCIALSFKNSSDTEGFYEDVIADPYLEFTFAQDKLGEILLSSIKTWDGLHPDPIVECKNIWRIPYLKRAVLRRKAKFEKDGNTPAVLGKWLYDLKKSVLVMEHLNMAHRLVRYMWEGYTSSALILKGQVRKIIYRDPTNSNHKDTEDDLKRLRDHLEREFKKIADDLDHLEKESKKIEAENDNLAATAMADKHEEIEEKQDMLTIRRASYRQMKLS